jgi:hypothetical protein
MTHKIIQLEFPKLYNPYTNASEQRIFRETFPKMYNVLHQTPKKRQVIEKIPITLDTSCKITPQTLDEILAVQIQHSITRITNDPIKATQELYEHDIQIQTELDKLPYQNQGNSNTKTSTQKVQERVSDLANKLLSIEPPQENPYEKDTQIAYKDAQYISTAIATAHLRKQLRTDEILERAITIASDNESILSQAFWDNYRRNGNLHHFSIRAHSQQQAAYNFTKYHHLVNRFGTQSLSSFFSDWHDKTQAENHSVPPTYEFDVMQLRLFSNPENHSDKPQVYPNFEKLTRNEQFSPSYEPIEYTEIQEPSGAQLDFRYKTNRGALFHSPLDLRIKTLAEALNELKKRTEK